MLAACQPYSQTTRLLSIARLSPTPGGMLRAEPESAARKHVIFQSDESVILILLISKIDQFHIDIKIYLTQFSLSPLCSVTALRALFHHYSTLSYTSLFIKSFNQSFDKSFFIHIMHYLLLNAGISTVDYSRHSL